jgi:hypothetical protein
VALQQNMLFGLTVVDALAAGLELLATVRAQGEGFGGASGEVCLDDLQAEGTGAGEDELVHARGAVRMA